MYAVVYTVGYRIGIRIIIWPSKRLDVSASRPSKIDDPVPIFGIFASYGMMSKYSTLHGTRYTPQTDVEPSDGQLVSARNDLVVPR